MIEVLIQPAFDAWRTAARPLLARRVPPQEILWQEDSAAQTFLPGLAETRAPDSGEPTATPVPKAFIAAARDVALYRDPDRWSLLYRLLYRITTENHDLMRDATDPDVREVEVRRQNIRRDIHKMHAFVRFRERPAEATDDSDAPPQYIAWYEPDHLILRAAAPFFVERFRTMRWAILTPDESAYYDGHDLRFGPGVPKSQAPSGDDLETLWTTYYASIFNPARIKTRMMTKEMPRRFWKNLPEAQQIDELLAAAPARVNDMVAKGQKLAAADRYPTAEPFIPKGRISLSQLREASKSCRGCPICELGTQTVFGEGPAHAKVVFVGEQPGDQEDRQGRPFVGPAGQLLNDALQEVGLDRSLVYVTNAVKHFKYEPRGERRIHAKPNAREIQSCKPWLVSELGLIKPQIVLALGATAAQAMQGPTFRITRDRGQPLTDTEWAPWWMATIHPSALLRIPDPALRKKSYDEFLSDLAVVAKQMKSLS